MDKARKTALAVLDGIFKDNSYSNITLDRVFASQSFSTLDRGFISALVYGVLDRKLTLDYIISKYLKKGIDKTPITVVNAIRLALYQIMYMDKVPESAAVNESVNLIKYSEHKYSAPLVNGVLRNILRNGTDIPNGVTVEDLSVKYSCSCYIVEDLINDLGFKVATDFLENSLLPPSVYLRVNTLKTTADELITALKSENINAVKCDVPDAVKINGSIDFKASKCFENGFFHAEDLSCQKAVDLLRIKEVERVLDMCSAPGGKAFTMAQNMKNTGEIIACDIYKSRTALIKSGAERLGISIIKPTVCDSSVYNDNLGLFDAVLCDVPCSGYGVIRRKPEIKYKPQTDFAELSAIQLNILSNADNYLKKGGRLLYSTCTLRNAENGDAVRKFLDNHSSYTLEFEHTFLPQNDFSDGFYCALLIKSR